MTKLTKPLLHAKLSAAGFVLKPAHWRDLDRLMKSTGFITPEAMLVQAHRWGWSKPMLDQLRAALKREAA